jgi:hypothetical protein
LLQQQRWREWCIGFACGRATCTKDADLG